MFGVLDRIFVIAFILIMVINGVMIYYDPAKECIDGDCKGLTSSITSSVLAIDKNIDEDVESARSNEGEIAGLFITKAIFSLLFLLLIIYGIYWLIGIRKYDSPYIHILFFLVFLGIFLFISGYYTKKIYPDYEIFSGIKNLFNYFIGIIK